MDRNSFQRVLQSRAARVTQVLSLLGFFVLSFSSYAQLPKANRSPNIILILIDDFGWADLRCYGSTFHQTPNIDALARRGLMLARQIGHSEFRIDIAVRDAQHPEQFVLGIECDGDDYRTAPTARDRERLREQMLGGLGWRIHRAWSAAWAADQAAEIERALAALDPSSR